MHLRVRLGPRTPTPLALCRLSDWAFAPPPHPSLLQIGIVLAEQNEKRIEQLTLASADGDFKPAAPGTPAAMRERIVRRAAEEFKDGMCVVISLLLPASRFFFALLVLGAGWPIQHPTGSVGWSQKC